MGIINPFLKIILTENKYKLFKGNLAVIGKQTVNIERTELLKMLENFKISTKKLKKIENFDTSTRQAKRAKLDFFFDHDIFKAINLNIKYYSIDRSNYEDASLIQDMNKPLKRKLKNKFDIVIDGGSMDNCFDPTNFLKNVSKMLKVGGRAILGNHFFQQPGAYLAFSPEYYFSYFSINNFRDVKIFIIQSKENKDKKNRHNYKTELYSYSPYFTKKTNYDYHFAVRNMNTINNVICIAEKSKQSTWHKIPCQIQYLDKKEEDWRKNFLNYKKYRKNFFQRKTKSKKQIFDSNHFRLLQNNF